MMCEVLKVVSRRGEQKHEALMHQNKYLAFEI